MLYIIRHGKTDWNEQKKLQGRTDIPLNEEGIMMAKSAHDEYLNIHIDECYTSPLIRAKETARLLLESRNIPIYEDNRLIEMGFGIYEGVAESFNIPDCPINILFREPEKYVDAPGGAESMKSLFDRTGEFLREVIYPKLEEGKDILIVGHGAMNSSIVCQVKDLSIKDFWSTGIPNCKIIRLI